MRRARNCDGAGDGRALALPGGLTQCPQARFGVGHIEWVNAFFRWQHMQLLPFPGRIEDQPVTVLHVFEAVHRALAAHAQEQAHGHRDGHTIRR